MFNFVGTPVPLVELESVEIDGKRFYPVPNGEKYPSVTTVTSVRSVEKMKQIGFLLVLVDGEPVYML
jgi:hypothetical protein